MIVKMLGMVAMIVQMPEMDWVSAWMTGMVSMIEQMSRVVWVIGANAKDGLGFWADARDGQHE